MDIREIYKTNRLIERYKQAGYSKEKVFAFLLNNMSKGEIVKIMGFERFTLDYAIPQNLWSSVDVHASISLYCNYNAENIDQNDRPYRVNFRVFPIVKVYKRFLRNELNKVYA